MRKRERENPCEICGHYHNYEQGEVCPVCGHRFTEHKNYAPQDPRPSMILPDFLYLGSYNHASNSDLLLRMGISKVLNTLCLKGEPILQFDEGTQFIEECERENDRVLVYCMSGKSRSASFVIAFLMKFKRWNLDQSYSHVQKLRPCIELSEEVYNQLQQYSEKVFSRDQEVA